MCQVRLRCYTFDVNVYSTIYSLYFFSWSWSLFQQYNTNRQALPLLEWPPQAQAQGAMEEGSHLRNKNNELLILQLQCRPWWLLHDVRSTKVHLPEAVARTWAWITSELYMDRRSFRIRYYTVSASRKNNYLQLSAWRVGTWYMSVSVWNPSRHIQGSGWACSMIGSMGVYGRLAEERPRGKRCRPWLIVTLYFNSPHHPPLSS